MRLPRLLRATEADQGLAACLGGGEAGADAVVDMHGDVAIEFVGEVGLCLL